MNVLITGATGFIGRALVLRLQRDAHEITAWVRDVDRARGLLGPHVTLITGATDTELNLAVGSASAIINLAGAPILDEPWTSKRRQVLLDSRVGVTRRLVQAMANSSERPAVFVSASAIGYYAEGGDHHLDESSPGGDDFAAQLCALWEEQALEASDFGARVVLARIGVVVGEGGMLGQLLPMYRMGLGGPLGPGRQFLSWIHIDDAVEALVFALADERCSGPVNVVGPMPVRATEFARELGAAVHRSAKLRVPKIALRLAIGRRARVVLANQRVTPAELERLGFTFAFPRLADALRDICGHETVHIRDATDWPDSEYLRSRKPRYVLEQDLLVPAPVDEVFEFFGDARNLALLTPPHVTFEMLASNVEMAPGETIDYRVRLGALPMGWTTSIEEWHPGVRFADAQLRGPYHCWWHEHRFQEHPEGTLIRDRVFYAPPLGGLGRLAHGLFIAPNLRRIFSFRNGAARRRFGLPRQADPQQDHTASSA